MRLCMGALAHIRAPAPFCAVVACIASMCLALTAGCQETCVSGSTGSINVDIDNSLGGSTVTTSGSCGPAAPDGPLSWRISFDTSGALCFVMVQPPSPDGGIPPQPLEKTVTLPESPCGGPGVVDVSFP